MAFIAGVNSGCESYYSVGIFRLQDLCTNNYLKVAGGNTLTIIGAAMTDPAGKEKLKCSKSFSICIFSYTFAIQRSD